MTSDSGQPVVSTDWLNDQLRKKKGGVAVLDVTWFSDENVSHDFSKKHLMHASQMDIFFGVENTPLYPGNIPDAPTFQMNARGSAVNSTDHVVVYENTGKFGFLAGARAWWLFKLFGHVNVSVLDGGLEKWILDGYETTDIMFKKMEGDFTAKLTPRWLKRFQDMKENLTLQKVQVCDSRDPSLFMRSADDPRTGHYPGAVNIPFPKLFDPETKSLKKLDDLKKVYIDAGIDLSKPLIGMGNSGMSSCSLVLAAHLCGCPEVAVYHGGFKEWKARANLSEID